MGTNHQNIDSSAEGSAARDALMSRMDDEFIATVDQLRATTEDLARIETDGVLPIGSTIDLSPLAQERLVGIAREDLDARIDRLKLQIYKHLTD